MQHHGLVTKVHPRLTPVDLALLARRRLEADAGALGQRLDRSQWLHEALHSRIAARVALALELLEKHLGRVADLRCSLTQELGMLGQQRVGAHRPLVGLPRRLLQAAADSLAIEIQATSDLGDRQLLFAGHPVDLPPAVFLDHAFLLEATRLGNHGASFTFDNLFHPEPPSRKDRVGSFR